MDTRRLYLISGAPGTGKTTLAHTLIKGHAQWGSVGCEHVEADMFFTDSSGYYKFDHSMLSQAHKWCQNRCLEAMLSDTPIIIVSNTFTKKWERAPYEKMAENTAMNVCSL